MTEGLVSSSRSVDENHDILNNSIAITSIEIKKFIDSLTNDRERSDFYE